MSTTIHAAEDRTLTARIVSSCALPGVHAGSALLRVGERLLAVPDDAFRVSWIALPGLAVASVALRGTGAQLAKGVKPDFEAALLAPDGAVHLLGSGSTERRCALARVDVAAAQVSFREHPELYRCVQDALGLRTRANVEGALARANALRLFHRGAGGAPSGTVDVPVEVLAGGAPHALAAQIFELGALDGIELGFTDAAALSGERTAFSAAAEDAPDAIADGPVAGSVLGVIEGAGRGAAARWTRIVDANGAPFGAKVEGLAIDADCRGAWILTDADDAASLTLLGRVELTGFD